MDSTISFRKLYKQLPQKTREVLAFEGFGEFVEEITKSNNFSREQNDKLIRLTVHVIVGTEDKKYFSEKIKEVLGVSQDTANILSTEIDQKIINNIDNLYQKIRGLEGDGDISTDDLFNLEEIRRSKNSVKINDLVDNIKGNKLNREISSLIELIKKVPESTRKLLGATEWLRRIKEFSSKYSLTEEQTITLIVEILLVLAEATGSEDLAENIEEEVGVSQILAEQLAEETEERIFKWIKQEPVVKVGDATHTIITEHANSLDIPPVNLPGEVIEESSNSWIPNAVPATPEKNHSILQDQVNSFFTPAATVAKVEMRPEPTVIPKTSFVPPAIQTPPKPQSFITNKLTQPTQPQQAAPIETPKIYTTDPYREPLE